MVDNCKSGATTRWRKQGGSGCHNLRSGVSFDLSAKHASGRMQPIDSSPDNLGPGLRKEFRVPSSRPLVIALSVDARLAPAACIIKLPACRNVDEAYLRGPRAHTRRNRERDERAQTPSRFTDTQLRAEFPLATRPLYSTLLASTCLFVAVHAARQTRRRTPTRVQVCSHTHVRSYFVFQPFSLCTHARMCYTDERVRTSLTRLTPTSRTTGVSSTLSGFSTLELQPNSPLTLIYLNYILRASAGERVCGCPPIYEHQRAKDRANHPARMIRTRATEFLVWTLCVRLMAARARARTRV